jgi:poly-gamma-glutamate synthesis protein (capsule biosynthesis protein)
MLGLLASSCAGGERAAEAEGALGAPPVDDAGAGPATSAALATPTSTTAGTTTTTAPPLRSFDLAVSGDILIHEPVRNAAARPDGTFDFAPLFADVAPVIADADLALCHLEVTLSPDNAVLTSYPMFRAPYQLADAIAGAGYDGCSLSSNHALDAGGAGVTATLGHLDRAGVAHTGTARSAEEAATTRFYDAGGVRVAHLSYSYGFNGLQPPAGEPWRANLIDVAAILDAAARARAEGAEVVVLSMHWGVEYVHDPTDQQRTLAEELLPSPDIDLIVGHHAHVVQPMARIGDELVIFGLGNFLSNQSAASGRAAATQDGVIVRVRVEEVAAGRFLATDVEAIPTTVERPTYVIRVAEPGSVPHDRTMQNLALLGGWALPPTTPTPE